MLPFVRWSSHFGSIRRWCTFYPMKAGVAVPCDGISLPMSATPNDSTFCSVWSATVLSSALPRGCLLSLIGPPPPGPRSGHSGVTPTSGSEPEPFDFDDFIESKRTCRSTVSPRPRRTISPRSGITPVITGEPNRLRLLVQASGQSSPQPRHLDRLLTLDWLVSQLATYYV